MDRQCEVILPNPAGHQLEHERSPVLLLCCLGSCPKMKQRILYVQYTNPAGYPPLEHSSRILAQEGWEVLFFGTGAFGANALCFPPHPNITVRQMPFCPPGWRQKLHYLQFCLWTLLWTVRWQPQWIYASDLLACPIALLLSFLPHVHLIYHEHDSPIEIPENFFTRFCFDARQRLAHRTKICILPNQQRADWFAKSTNCEREPICVWNCPRKEDVVQQRNPQTVKPLKLYYHGNISSTLVPITILDAIAKIFSERNTANIVNLQVVGYTTIGNEVYLENLRQHAKKLGIEECLQIMSPVPRHKLLLLAQKCDIGLALMPMDSKNLNLSFLTGASNKPFDYMASGLALLVSKSPDWQQLYVEPGYGLSCDPNDPESIAKVLNWYLEHPVEMRSMGELGRQRILAEWNYETQFAGVQNLLGQACKG
jgi:glycosyltransferase involved in cell wall biosynthesis